MQERGEPCHGEQQQEREIGEAQEHGNRATARGQAAQGGGFGAARQGRKCNVGITSVLSLYRVGVRRNFGKFRKEI
jgi:hypothetical protein